MTAKFEVNGETVTINASMEILNEIAGMANSKARDLREKGRENASKRYDDWFNGIYNALDAKGFYKGYKIER